jgi:hypothetical protein
VEGLSLETLKASLVPERETGGLDGKKGGRRGKGAIRPLVSPESHEKKISPDLKIRN